MSVWDKKQVRQIREIIFLRTQRADFFHKSSFYLQPLVQKIADTLGVEYSDLLNFSPPEIIAALRGKFNIKGHVRARRENMITYHDTDSLYLEGAQATEYIQKHPALNVKIQKVALLSGKPAYPGKIRGKAKIVLANTDLPKVNKGDILITTMTTPNFIAAMERAAAFVTDEGGILCHAAIISREMKKPCVIGTRFASQVFKDGEIVEVNANKGMIRKI